MSWARRLTHVFGIEIEQCVRCGGRLTVIASIEQQELIERILARRREQGGEETLTVAVARRTATRGFRPSNALELGANAPLNRLNAAREAATLTTARATRLSHRGRQAVHNSYPQRRSTITVIWLLDRPADFARVRTKVACAASLIPRLRERVEPDPLGIAPPVWEEDPH